MSVATQEATASHARYTSVAIALHWLIALLFLGSYVSVYYRRYLTEKQTPENMTALQIHLAIGVTIAAIVALRILWRLTHTPPPLEPGPRWQHTAAHGLHYLLYAVMIIMPITGYLGTGVATEYFGIPKFEDTALFQWLVADKLQLTFKDFEKPIDFIHKNGGAYLIWVLILGHAAAALYHHVAVRDATLTRMLPARDA
jgi:cytochrome b561